MGTRLVNFAPLQWADWQEGNNRAPTTAPSSPPNHPTSLLPNSPSPGRRVIKILSENCTPLLGFFWHFLAVFLCWHKNPPREKMNKMSKFLCQQLLMCENSARQQQQIGNIRKLYIYYFFFNSCIYLCIASLAVRVSI